MKTVNVQQAVDLLNELNAIDGNAISDLIDKRSFCNNQLGEHPTVQCGMHHGHCTVGLLGVLNGLFGDGSYGPIVAVCKSDGKTVVKFAIAENPKALSET